MLPNHKRPPLAPWSAAWIRASGPTIFLSGSHGHRLRSVRTAMPQFSTGHNLNRPSSSSQLLELDGQRPAVSLNR
jgi:hypothetical protein